MTLRLRDKRRVFESRYTLPRGFFEGRRRYELAFGAAYAAGVTQRFADEISGRRRSYFDFTVPPVAGDPPASMRRGEAWRKLGLALFVALIPCAALGHGDAGWIMDAIETSWCCGPEDCARAPIGAVERTAFGWMIKSTGQQFHEGDRGLFRSRDDDYWWCRPGGDGAVRCLFVPPEGV